MKLTIGQIHDAVTGLSMLEDPEIKLSGETVLAMAINLHRLKSFAIGYEQARARALSNSMTEGQEGKKTNQEIEAMFVQRDMELRDKVEDVELKMISLKALGLGSNPKIRPVAVSRLLPILSDHDL